MNSPWPTIRKAERVIGRTLVMRDATIADAEFILALRTDERRSQHLSKTSPDLDTQIHWLANYAKAQDQAYFIIENAAGEAIGSVRLYDPQKDSFCWGSWILKEGAPQTAAIESALMVYAYALDHLGFRRAHFDVRKANESVWRFHERFGAERVSESEQDYFYKIDFAAIEEARRRYKKFLRDPVVVEWLP